MADLTLSDTLINQLHQHADQRSTSIENLISDLLEQDRQSVPPKMYQDLVEQLDLVSKAAHLGIWVLDLRTSHLEWNDELLKIYGITRDQFEHDLNSWQNSVHPEDQDYAESRLNQAIDGKRVFDVPFRVVRPDGEIRHLSGAATPVFDDKGNVIKVIGNNIDVTKLHKAQYTIRHQTAAIEAISEAVIILDTNFNIISWNPQAEQIYGWQADEALGKSMTDVIQTTYIDATNQEVTDAFLRNGIWKGEAIQRRKNGEQITVLASVSTLYDEQKQPIAYIGVNRDITARKRAIELEASHRTLGMQLQKEKEITRLRSRMLRTIAHEFRTPLTTILTSVELLVTYGEGLEKGSRMRHMEKINRQITTLDQFIEEMRLFAHGEYQMFMGDTEKITLPAFLHEVIDDIRPILKENQVIETSIPDDLPIIDCNPPLFRLALANLLSNAIKYSPANSPIRFSATQVNDKIELVVKDEGIGIPEADRKYLFEPFKRASNSDAYTGNGIGLSIVKEAIERHQGTIRYESEVGIGTTFTVDIPINTTEGRNQAV